MKIGVNRLPELLDPLVKKGLQSVLLFGVLTNTQTNNLSSQKDSTVIKNKTKKNHIFCCFCFVCVCVCVCFSFVITVIRNILKKKIIIKKTISGICCIIATKSCYFSD